MKTLLLIDSSALIYRFFHALPPLTTPEHDPIQAVYGLINILIKIFKEQKPDYIAAALDRPEKTFREEKFTQYKIQRPPAPDALIFQIKKLPEVFGLFGINIFEMPSFEADDIIGTIVQKFSNEPDLKIIILSGDLDVLQLVKGEKIIAQIIKTGISYSDFYDSLKVFERYGLQPEELTDYKGLIGDSSDNFPGIKGIGPKTAVPLIKEFKNLEGVFENMGIIPDKIAKKLEGKKEEALMFRELATIKRDVAINLESLESLKTKALDVEKLKYYFNKLGFVSLIRRLEDI